MSPPVEVKKPPYIEYEERGEGWDASCLGITFVFEELKDDQFEELKEMIQSWFWLGYLGGYGGVFSAYLTDIWHEGNAAGTMVDIAGCPEEEAALKILERSVNGFAWEKGLTLQQMILGEYDDAQPDE